MKKMFRVTDQNGDTYNLPSDLIKNVEGINRQAPCDLRRKEKTRIWIYDDFSFLFYLDVMEKPQIVYRGFNG